MAEEAKYYCKGCGTQIGANDTTCPNCGKPLKEVGRHITIVLSGSIALSDNVSALLTKSEQSTIQKIWEWLRSKMAEYDLSEFEIGFPSGVKVKYVHKKNNEWEGHITKPD